MTDNSDKPQTFFDAQVAFAKSKHGRAQKAKDKHGYRYQKIKQAATQTRSDAKECKDDNR